MADPTPDPIMRVASGFMTAKYLFVASEVGLFAGLADGPLGLDDLARRLGLPRHTTRILADALVTLGLVERRDDRYENAPASAVSLAGRTATDLRPLLRFLDQLNYPLWQQLEAAVRTAAVARGELTAEQQQIYSEGVEALTAGTARALATRYDFRPHRRLLDLGGGTGSFLLTVLGQAPHLAGTLFDAPAVAAIARQRLAATSVAGRVEIIGGDFFRDPIPEGHDVVLVANVLHLFGPERNRVLLRQLRGRTTDGGRLLLVDLWTDATHTQPPFAALMAGQFLLHSSEGDVYSVDEAASWLGDTGWQLVEEQALTGTWSLLVAEAAS
jgi:cyclopropane fatty-acyl-phospholipid synthase-like methyltransferase